MSAPVSERERREVAERAYHVCEYCLIHEEDTFWGCEVDHIISRKHGGDSSLDNLAWACPAGNRYEGSDLDTLVGQPNRGNLDHGDKSFSSRSMTCSMRWNSVLLQTADAPALIKAALPLSCDE